MAGVGVMVVAGAAAWPLLRPSALESLLGVLALALLALASRGRPVAWGALLAAALLLGMGAAGLRPAAPQHREGTTLVGRVKAVAGASVQVSTAQGLVRGHSDLALMPGDLLALRLGSPTRPVRLPGAPGDRAADLRGGLQPMAFAQALPLVRSGGARADPFATADNRGLLRALALGDRAQLDDSTRELLRRTGTTHLLSISGLHVGLLAGAVAGLAWLFCRPLALTRAWPLARVLPALVAIATAFSYTQFVGAPASARRSAVMVAAAAGAVVLGRRPRGASLLGMAAAGLTLVDPGLVGDLGFQLSFSAMAGIMLVGPRVTRLLPPDQPAWRTWVVGSLASTVGATAGTLPLTCWHIQDLAPTAPLANLVAVPIVGSFVVPAATAGVVLPGVLGRLAVTIADRAMDLSLWLLQGMDAEPWHPAVGPLGALVLGLAVLLRRRPAQAALLALLALGLRAVPAERLTVTFLGIGQGDATLIEWPDGRRWLVDGGPPSSAVLHYLRRRGIRRLDALVLSHDHPDHSGGLIPVAQGLPFDALWLPRPPPEPLGEAWTLWRLAFTRGVPVHLPDDPAPAGVLVEHPLAGWRARGREPTNEESLVLRLVHGQHRVLLTGDVEKQAERGLALTQPPVTLVKVPHHGSRTSSTLGLVAALKPAVALISCGRDNRFGHPHAVTLGTWLHGTVARDSPRCTGGDVDGWAGCRPRLLRTDLDGTVEWSSDGQRWWVRTWRADRGWRALDSAPLVTE